MVILVKVFLAGSLRLLLLGLSLLLLSVVSLLGLALQSERFHRVLLGLRVGIRCGPCWIVLLQLRAKYWYMVLIRGLGVVIVRRFTSFRGGTLVISRRCLRILVLGFRWRGVSAALLDLLLAAELLRH